MALVETLFMADVSLEWENRWTKLAVNKESVARPPSALAPQSTVH